MDHPAIGAPIAAAAAKVAIEKRLDRVKICSADDYRWASYDTSRNHSRQWCSMEVCGNSAKGARPSRTHCYCRPHVATAATKGVR
ncbi:MAG: CGNR zinc finger domain-containing protein [Propionicimonas sp.]